MVPKLESGLVAAGLHVTPSNRSQMAGEFQDPLPADRASPGKNREVCGASADV
jgi:hypothetical protein